MIKIDLTVNEVNAILFALAKQPYESVATLIDKIREQALPQVPEEDRNDNREKLKQQLTEFVEAEEVN
jgi:hypothetical protein